MHSLCRIIGSGDMDRWEELILACTLDCVWVPTRLLLEVSEAFSRFYRQENEKRGSIVPTTRQISMMLEQMRGMFGVSMIGAGFNMCAEVPPFWEVYTDGGTKPYNVFSEENHETGMYVGKRPICRGVLKCQC